jgi:spore coat polysaccharide biosynthesis protein SpsF
MEVGQSGDNLKAGIIIQARLGSTRLPGKVLYDLGGVPLLEFLIKRIESSNIPIIVATTQNQEDDKIVSLAKKLNIAYFRGDENNVLSRFYFCALENQLDIIIRLTSDNPFLEGAFIATHLRSYLSYQSDNIYMATGISKSFPMGISMEIFSFTLLEKAYHEAEDEKEQEHVTPYIYHKLPVEKVGIQYKEVKSHYRLTIDTPQDFELAKTIVEDFEGRTKRVEEIIQIMDLNEHLADINKSTTQKKWNE